MKKADFTALPLSIALGLLWDHVPGLESILLREHIPDVPKPPRFDTPLFRANNGVTYASESSVRDLEWNRARAQASAESGGEFAEKDKKKEAALRYWIEWRLIEPNARWSGKRGDEQVTAAPPSDKPQVYDRQPRAASPKAREDRKPMSFDEEDKVADAFDESGSPF